MITQRFRPIMWVGGVAIAATGLYLISVQVAGQHKRLENVNAQIIATEHTIRELQTEISTRANMRQLEKWNSDSLALAAPRASQYLNNTDELEHFDLAQLNGKTTAPEAKMAAVTSDKQSIAAATVAPSKQAAPAKMAMLSAVVAQAPAQRTTP